MDHFFQFEQEFVESLHCIPMIVRLKLDSCGVKLKLNHWNQFTSPEKQVLVTMACETPEEANLYRDFLQTLVTEKTGSPAKTLPIDDHPAWLNNEQIPVEIQEKAAEFNKEITLEQWNQLTPLQRFALIKLSRPSHENSNFYPALQEFNL
ncbi:nitrate reductase associated protein [Cyanothece sp. BG0011]|uniref:nitrate reductase associated protein n=1 Tax=Cyanothece sp. BG0011 TaxID=2082950 RepID=UPI000D1F772E|nr:nitrate reductase associated protein [Cyanothece sp. BG0011]